MRGGEELVQAATKNLERSISFHPEHPFADDDLCPPRHSWSQQSRHRQKRPNASDHARFEVKPTAAASACVHQKGASMPSLMVRRMYQPSFLKLWTGPLVLAVCLPATSGTICIPSNQFLYRRLPLATVSAAESQRSPIRATLFSIDFWCLVQKENLCAKFNLIWWLASIFIQLSCICKDLLAMLSASIFFGKLAHNKDIQIYGTHLLQGVYTR